MCIATLSNLSVILYLPDLMGEESPDSFNKLVGGGGEVETLTLEVGISAV